MTNKCAHIGDQLYNLVSTPWFIVMLFVIDLRFLYIPRLCIAFHVRDVSTYVVVVGKVSSLCPCDLSVATAPNP